MAIHRGPQSSTYPDQGYSPPVTDDLLCLSAWLGLHTNATNLSLYGTDRPPTDDVRPDEPHAALDWCRDILLGLVLAGLSLLTIVGNTLVLHAVRTERRLQSVSNMFIVSLAIADMIVGLIVMPISAIYIFTLDWLFGVAVCQFWISVDYTASTASILNLFILSLDRYWSVSSPLRYLRQRTKRRALVMISLVWFVSSLWLIPIIGWHYFEHDGVRTVPANVCDTEYATNTALKIVTGLLNFYVPITVMYALYGKIFLEIKRRSKLELGQQIGRAALDNSCVIASDDSDDRQYVDSIPLQVSIRRAELERNGQCAHSGAGRAGQRRGTDPETDTDQTDDEQIRMHASGYTNVRLVRVSMSKLSPLEIYPDTLGADYRQQAQYLYDEPVSGTKPVDSLVGERYEYQQPENGPGRDEGLAPEQTNQPTNNASSTNQSTNCSNRVRFQLDHDNSDSRTPVSLPKETHPAKNTYVVKPHVYLSTKLSSGSEDEVCVSRMRSSGPNSQSRSLRKASHQRYNKLHRIAKPNFVQGRHGRSAPGRSKHHILQTSALIRQAVRWRHRPHKQKTSPSSALSKEIKAARQLGVIMGAFTLCFLPYFICFMVVAFCEKCVDPGLMTAVTWIGYLNSTLNPFIYPMCNANFRRKFREMLRLSRANDGCRNSVCYSRNVSAPVVHDT